LNLGTDFQKEKTMLDWKQYRDEIAARLRDIRLTKPDIIKAYGELHHANIASTHLDAKTRELIALAVSVTLRCDGCINAHTEAAVKAGASKDEVVEALSVAIMVNAGAAMVYSARTMDAFDTYTKPAGVPP
jgi:AhpD family alkylhydroperoxidase